MRICADDEAHYLRMCAGKHFSLFAYAQIVRCTNCACAQTLLLRSYAYAQIMRCMCYAYA